MGILRLILTRTWEAFLKQFNRFRRWFAKGREMELFAIFLSILLLRATFSYYDTRVVESLQLNPLWESPAESIVEEMLLKVNEQREGYLISHYDEIFISICREYDLDWRFMSAIAYVESRFKPLALSRGGAVGLMQIMPRIGRAYRVESEMLYDVETSIRVAALHLIEIERMLSVPRTISDRDYLSLVLVCYNGGIGRLFDAQRLTREATEDPYKWVDVRRHLVRLRSPEMDDHPLVYYGQYSGARHTVAYVRDVLNKFDEYVEVCRDCSATLYPYVRRFEAK